MNSDLQAQSKHIQVYWGNSIWIFGRETMTTHLEAGSKYVYGFYQPLHCSTELFRAAETGSSKAVSNKSVPTSGRNVKIHIMP